MGRVFEALQRQQKRKQKRGESEQETFTASEQETFTAADPPGTQTGLPASAPDHESTADFGLPEVIGAPVAARSIEGATWPLQPDEQVTLAPEAAPPDPQTRPVTAANGQGVRGLPLTGEPKELDRTTPPSPGAGLQQAGLPPPPRGHGRPSPIRHLPSAIRHNYAPPQTIAPQVGFQAQLVAARLHPRLVLSTSPQSPACEQYRTLRTQVFHAAERRPAQVIVITSAVAGEGKTSTALNLAWAIAQSKEKRVLLVDSDLRRPNVASYLGLRPEVGLGEVLNDECAALGSIIRLANPELYLLPVSREAAHPTELLSRERLGETIASLRRYFDFILIDSPPVMPFADARLLANHADAVMLIVRAGTAPYHTIERAVEALPEARLLGVVLNDAEESGEADYYDYYYNYQQRERARLFAWGRFSRRLKRGCQPKER